jgi:murein DD-endopeptidase MepM/ murein hydrolase activator NlpD
MIAYAQVSTDSRAGRFPTMTKFTRTPGCWIILLLIILLLVGGWFTVVQRFPHVPTRGVMLHPFGVPVSYQTCGFHTGSDWFAPVGTPVYAIEDGSVVYVGPLWLSGPGVGRGDYSIILFHEEGDYYTTYGHNSVALVIPGERVSRGQKIAEVGDEGYSPSPHLHLEKVTARFTGDWQQPFVGCDGYVDPGNMWSPF